MQACAAWAHTTPGNCQTADCCSIPSLSWHDMAPPAARFDPWQAPPQPRAPMMHLGPRPILPKRTRAPRDPKRRARPSGGMGHAWPSAIIHPQSPKNARPTQPLPVPPQGNITFRTLLLVNRNCLSCVSCIWRRQADSHNMNLAQWLSRVCLCLRLVHKSVERPSFPERKCCREAEALSSFDPLRPEQPSWPLARLETSTRTRSSDILV